MTPNLNLKAQNSLSFTDYKKSMIGRFWEYQKDYFPNWQDYLERPIMDGVRPPVFLKHAADYNVINAPDISDLQKNQLLDEISIRERHRWFRSMSSSQALAQSVFANLKVYGCLHYLQELCADSGEPLFGDVSINSNNFIMEYTVRSLGEPRPTSVDTFIAGEYQIAIECKLTEAEIGSCSRPKLTEKNFNFQNDFCNGTYTCQRNRKQRCSLTERGVSYWHYIPDLFKWRDDSDLIPCPLNKNYQLVRNILAACVNSDGAIYPKNGHAVLIYDNRNPAFQEGGKGLKAFVEVQNVLHQPGLLKKCSWQNVLDKLRNKNDLKWLTDQLKKKYGL